MKHHDWARYSVRSDREAQFWMCRSCTCLLWSATMPGVEDGRLVRYVGEGPSFTDTPADCDDAKLYLAACEVMLA